MNDPTINAAMDKAETLVGREAREKAWAAIDRELVADAAAVPYDWDKAAEHRVQGRRRRRRPVELGPVGLQLHLAEVGR